MNMVGERTLATMKLARKALQLKSLLRNVVGCYASGDEYAGID